MLTIPGRWAVLLSGGDGRRMREFLALRGETRPKQYCALLGEQTMIETAAQRALTQAPPDQVVTVLGRGHRLYLQSPRLLAVPGRLIEQPRSCGTGTGVLLGLTAVMVQNADAVAAIFPVDHYIEPLGAFARTLGRAYELAESLPTRLILLAARPQAPDHDYGWILPSRPREGGGLLVKRFVEKPAPAQAQELLERGGLLNTMIVVARVSALWGCARSALPSVARRLESLRPCMGTALEAEALEHAYREFPEADFSRHILERFSRRLVALPLEGVEWSDWGRPERVVRTLGLPDHWGMPMGGSHPA